MRSSRQQHPTSKPPKSTPISTHAEIACAIPEPEHLSNKHVYPDLTTCHFHHWIPLIASSQGFSEWHKIRLPLTLIQKLLDANAV
jgi:hypothetical protein